jgi:4-amino-4-deoxy-L-arabinose transferase-like glycosyltransferase
LLIRADRFVLALALAAVALTLAYGVYLSPDWDPSRNDQVQYLALARGLVERGEYTRAMVTEPFIPEPLRFPGYPLFLAPLCVAGCSLWAIAVAQALLLGALVLMVARLAAPLVGPRGARVAAGLVALYPGFAFFGAHVLSDVLGAVLGVATVLVTVSLASRAPGLAGVAPGALAAATTLTRPFLVFTLPLVVLAVAWRRGARGIAAAVAVAAIVFVIGVSPYVAYMERGFGRPVAGSTGAQLWLGYFQGMSGPLDAYEADQAEAGKKALAQFDAISDRVVQAQAFVALDDQLRTRALALIAHDPVGFTVRGVARSIVLWAGDVPARTEHQSAALTGIWVALNLVFLGVGLAGAVRLWRRGDGTFAIPLLIIVTTWVLSYPLWAEGRFSLPARPFLFIGVAAFVEDLIRGRRV